MSVTTIPLWERPEFEASGEDGEAEVAMFAFSRGDLPDDVPFSMSRFGAPSREVAAALDVTTIERKADVAWFDRWRSDALRRIAERELGDLAELDAADQVHVVRMTVSDPKDLAHLQTSWAAAKWLVERGANVVLDAHASRWWSKAAVAALAPDRALSIEDEIVIVAETDRSEGFGHALHTRGMRKFGRPDVVIAAPAPGDPVAADVVRQIAVASARGKVFRAGQRVELAGGARVFAEYDPGKNAPELNLDNDAWLIQSA